MKMVCAGCARPSSMATNSKLVNEPQGNTPSHFGAAHSRENI